MTSRKARRWLALAFVALTVVACKRSPQLPHKQRPKSEPIVFEPIVSAVSQTLRTMPSLPPGTGTLRVVVQNRVEGVSIDVTAKVRLYFHPLDRKEGNVLEFSAGGAIRLPAGRYRVDVRYEVTRLVQGRGRLVTLRVHERVEHQIQLRLSYRFDTFNFQLTNLGRPVAPRSVIQVFRAGDLDKKEQKPLVQQPGSAPVILPAGTYDLRLIFREANGLSSTKSITDFIVRGELKTISRTLDFDYSVGTLRVKVTNRNQDVSKKCRIAVYRLTDVGANQKPTSAPMWKGVAGEVTTLPAGTYAVWVHYQEPDGELLKGEQWVKPVTVRGRYQSEELAVTFNLSWGEVVFRVREGLRDVNEQTRVFVFHSREPERALDHERGGKSLKLLSGSYDFKAVYLAPNSPLEQRKVLWRRDVKVLSNAKTVVEFQFAPPGLPAPTPTSKPAKTGTLPTPKTPAPSKKMPEK